MNAQNCMCRKLGLEFQHFSSLKDRQTTAYVGGWKQSIKRSDQVGKSTSAASARTNTVGQDKHHKACRVCRAQAPRSSLNAPLVDSDVMLSVIFISTVYLHQNWP